MISHIEEGPYCTNELMFEELDTGLEVLMKRLAEERNAQELKHKAKEDEVI